MKRIALSTGHSPFEDGADHDGLNEHELAAEWVAIIGSYLHGKAEIIHVPTGYLRAKVDFINEQNCDHAVEVHFNSAHVPVVGYETLHCPNSVKGIDLAMKLQQAMHSVLPTRNRGIKEGWYQGDKKNGPLFFLEKTNCPAAIIEPAFIQNYRLIEPYKRNCCRAIAEALV